MKHGIPIRASLGVLVLATALPFVALIAYNAYSRAQHEAEQAGAEAMRAARATASEAKDTLQRAEQLLSVLSTRPAVRSLDAAHCAPIFAAFGKLYPEYTNLLTVHRSGERRCSAVQPAAGVPAKVDPKLYLAETLRSRAFTVAPVIRGAFSGHWIALAAYPIPDDRDEIGGVVAVAIDLAKLRLAPRPGALPPRAVARIVDAGGTVVASSVAPEKWIGQNFTEVPWFRLLQPGRAAVMRASDSDGAVHILGTAPIDGTTWHAVVGIPIDVVYGPVRQRAMLNAVISLLALLLAAALGYLTARRIAGPVEAIAAAAREATQSASGHELAQARVCFAPREIRTLADDFQAMLKARTEAERDLHEREAGLRRAQLMARLAHVITRPDGSFESWSETLPPLIGVDPARVPHSTREWLDIVHPDDRERFREKSIEAGTTGERLELEYRLRRADGPWIDVRQAIEPIEGEPDAQGRVRWFSTLQDVTEQKQAEEKIKRLNRVYAVLSGINALIVRVRDRDELFREACRIAVEAGKLRFAWVGLVDSDAMQLEPVAWDGDKEDFLGADRMRFSLSESDSRGHSMVADAVRAKKTMISNDVVNDPRILFKQEHSERGARSIAAFPLIVSNRVVGVYSLHAAEVGFFDDEELRLLTELASDISFALEHIEKTERVDYLAYYDSLTGLPNRALFHKHLEQFLHTAEREQHKLALLVLDIERFKSINDTLGRHAGDALLKQVAERMVRSRGDPTRIARLSADHFALVLPRVTDEELARRIENSFQELFGLPYSVGDTELRISAKIGIALYPSDAADAEALFRNAEAALKKAKQTGERHLFYAEQMTRHVAERLTLENKLRQALERGELVLHYQPKIDLKTSRIVGTEALMRWNSPELGLVPPVKFIPLMEETGLILEAGAWAMRRAVQDHLEWQRQGFGALRVAVNVSPIQLRMRNFVAVVEEALRGGAAPPGIDLEITESLIMEDIQDNIEKLKATRSLGVSIAIDDFGTGYSSLAYLAKLPVEMLKIDRSFIITMLNDPDTATLVQTIISLAHSLKLKVVAEGVDAEGQAKVLRRLRCDQMQGYLFSKPLPRDQMTALLKAKV